VASGNYFLDGFVQLDSNPFALLAPFYPFIRPLLKPRGREWLEVFRAGRARSPFVFVNCRKPLRFPDASVDHILASHFLEHLNRDDVLTVLKGFRRILKPGGTVHVIIPDLEIRARAYLREFGTADAPNKFVASLHFNKDHHPPLRDRVLALTGMFDMQHCWMYDVHSISALLRECGFELLPQNSSPSADFRRNDEEQVNLIARRPL
jgi:predicted SAM-dependent methyltransferase